MCKNYWEQGTCGILLKEDVVDKIREYLYNGYGIHYPNSTFITNDQELLKGLKAIGYETILKTKIQGIESFMLN